MEWKKRKREKQKRRRVMHFFYALLQWLLHTHANHQAEEKHGYIINHKHIRMYTPAKQELAYVPLRVTGSAAFCRDRIIILFYDILCLRSIYETNDIHGTLSHHFFLMKCLDNRVNCIVCCQTRRNLLFTPRCIGRCGKMVRFADLVSMDNWTMEYSFSPSSHTPNLYVTPNYSLPFSQLLVINITHKYNHTARRPITGQQLQLLFAVKQCIHMLAIRGWHCYTYIYAHIFCIFSFTYHPCYRQWKRRDKKYKIQ